MFTKFRQIDSTGRAAKHVLAGLLVCSLAGGAAAAPDLSTVIKRGVPTADATHKVESIRKSPIIDQEGRVAVVAVLREESSGIINDGVVLRATQAGPSATILPNPALHLVARMNQTPSGADAGTFITNYQRLNLRNGRIAMQSRLSGAAVTTATDSALCITSPFGDLMQAMREGTPLANNEAFLSFSPPVLTGIGTLAFGSQLTPASLSLEAILRRVEAANGVGFSAFVARRGQTAPGLIPNTFSGFGSESSAVLVSGSGRLRFVADTTGTLGSRSGIWIENSSGVLQLGPASGRTIVHPDGNFTIRKPKLISTNSAGDALFTSLSTSDANPALPDAALVRHRAGQTALMIARQGRAAPGITDGAVFDLGMRLPNTPAAAVPGVSAAMNADGFVAFVASLTSDESSNSGLWTADPSGSVKLVVREGMTSASGMTLTGPIRLIGINRLATIVFESGWSTADGQSGRALWYFRYGCNGGMITRTGEGTSTYTVRTFYALTDGAPSGGDDGLPMALNDSDQFSFTIVKRIVATQADSPAVIIADLNIECIGQHYQALPPNWGP